MLVALLAACGRSTPDRGAPSATDAPPPPPPPVPSAPAAPALRPQLDGRAFPDKVLALTWDDGPDVHTLELARYLHARHISATFFVVARWIDGVSSDPGSGTGVLETGYDHLDVLGELRALGHRIGNHTLNHVLLGEADAATVVRQLGEADERLSPFLGEGMRLFRAPGGSWSAAASSAVDGDPATRRLVGPVRWDVDGKDWETSLYCRSSSPAVECEPDAPGGRSRVKVNVAARRYLAAVEEAGHGIVLLHDRVGHVGSRYALTLAERLIPELETRGYVFAAPVLRFAPPAPRAWKRPASRAAVEAPQGADFADAGATVRSGDLNGDGRADVCGMTREGVLCALGTGRGFARATVWMDAEAVRGWSEIELVDVNGDGRADLCGTGPEGAVCGVAP